MAALLTSEMDRTDKIVQYMEESRAMGLAIAPPDVNRSGARFTVEGEVLRFGLAAIKNVGESAIDSIVRLRQETGAFASLTDFCARVDLRLLNRRVLESLIKAGACDGFGGTRAGLLGSLDQAMEAGQRRQRDREEGQTSLFDALGGASSAAGRRRGARAARRKPPSPNGRRSSFSPTKRTCSASTSPVTRSSAIATGRARLAPPPPPTWPPGRWGRA